MATPTVGGVVAAASSTQILAAPIARRNCLILCNDGSEVAYLSFGVAAELNKGVRMAPGEKQIFSREDVLNYAVFGISAAGTPKITFWEDSY